MYGLPPGDEKARALEGHPADRRQFQGDDAVLSDAEVGRDPLRGGDLPPVALAVVEGEGDHVESLFQSHGEGCRRVHSSGEEHDRLLDTDHRRLDKPGTVKKAMRRSIRVPRGYS